MKPEPVTLALLLTTARGRYDWNRDDETLTARVVQIVDGTHVRNISDSPYDNPAAGLAELSATATNSPDNATHDRPACYGWTLAYQPIGRLEWTDIDAKHRAMSAIRRKMAAAESKLGYPSTFGLYVLRLADAIGARTFLLDTNPDQPGSTYDDREYRWTDAQGAASWLDRQDREYIATHAPNVSA